MKLGSIQSHLDLLVRGSLIPGVQYLAVTSEQTLFEYSGGWADIACHRPMLADSTLMGYSMSKTITAAAVLQVIESENIALDEPIDRFIDSCPYGPEVTIRRVLAHTAGIPNPIPLKWVHSPAVHATFDEHAALVAVLQKKRHLSFRPGTRYGYSNLGYWLLGELVERLTGLPFTAYTTESVLLPLGITPQELGYSLLSPAAHSHGYLEKYSLMNLFKRVLVNREFIGSYHGNWLEIYPHHLNGAAFGGLVGTARGFAKFLQDQLRPRSVLFTESARRHFYEQQRTNSGELVQTSLGWHLGMLNGVSLYYKEGGGAGFHSMMRLYPGSGLGTVLMTNATGFDVRSLLDRLDCEFLGSA